MSLIKFFWNFDWLFQYDFSLETEVKKVFDNFDQLKIEAESEEETEKEVPERPPPPAIPKRNFEVEPKENDSGVSSGGENPTDVLQEILPDFFATFSV